MSKTIQLIKIISAITVLGVPAEILKCGAMYGWFLITFCFVCAWTAFLFVPVFYKMELKDRILSKVEFGQFDQKWPKRSKNSQYPETTDRDFECIIGFLQTGYF